MAIGNDFLTNLRKAQVVKKTITRSVGDLIRDFQTTKIVIPSYQRTFVWSNDKQCRFIESIFLQIPIPAIFLLEKIKDDENDNTGRVIFEVIDGVQRITTIANFVNGLLKLANLETLTDLNQAKFSQLPSSISDLFMEREIDTIIIQSGTDPEIQFEVFGRLNQGSVSLNPQELRNCMFHGIFNDFLIGCSGNTTYRELLEPFSKFKTPKEGTADKNRMFDVELVLRFFCVYELFDSESNKYPEIRAETLNGYMRDKNSDKFRSLEDLEEIFKKVIEMIKIVYSGNQFRNFLRKKDQISFVNTLSQSVFEVQMLGFVDYDISQLRGKTEIIYETFLDMSSYDLIFSDAMSKATGSKINERVIIWKNRLKDVLENSEKYYAKLDLKKRLFQSNPTCQATGSIIESLDQADVLDGKLYYRCSLQENDVIKSDKIIGSRATKKTPVRFYLDGSVYEAKDVPTVVDEILDIVRDRITGSDFDIQRLSSLEFIDTHQELSKKCTKPNKTFKSTKLERQGSGVLYFDASGGRNEVLSQLREIARLFEFMKDFRIED